MERNMTQYRRLIAVLMVSVAVSHPASAQQASAPPDRCFRIEQFQSWRAPDARTIYIRVLFDKFYRLDLAGVCPALKTPGSRLITHTRGPDLVCEPIDWDLRVSDGMSGFTEPCIVKTMTPLAPAEVSAIPKGFKP
jgi:hypothetical protein